MSSQAAAYTGKMFSSISLSMFTYKPRLVGEGGFSLRVAYQLNYVFLIHIRSFTYKPRGFLPGTYGIVEYWIDFFILVEYQR